MDLPRLEGAKDVHHSQEPVVSFNADRADRDSTPRPGRRTFEIAEILRASVRPTSGEKTEARKNSATLAMMGPGVGPRSASSGVTPR